MTCRKRLNLLRKNTGAAVATNELRLLDIRTWIGGPTMPVEANITACGDSTSEHTPNNWKSIGDIARALAAQAVRK